MSIRPSDARTAFLVGAGLLMGKAILGPLALIWALNTLFPLSIPFTFKSWLAALALLLVLRSFTGKTGRWSDADEDDAEYGDEDGDDYADEYADEADAEDDFPEEAEARRQKLKENLIVYHPAAKKKKGPSDDKS